MSIEYLLTCLVVILLPGTGVLYTIAIGLSRGFRLSVAAALGCTFGIVPAALASIVGLAAVLHTSALAYQVIRYAGVVYLFYMAWTIFRDNGPMVIDEKAPSGSVASTIVSGMLLNVLNPKLSLFFLAFLPQFLPAGTENSTVALINLAFIFMVMTFIVFIGYGACAAFARQHVISRPSVMKWIKRTFAGTFGLLGLKLALSDR